MFNHYVFYKNAKEGKECWCTSCNKHFEYSLPRTFSKKETDFLYAGHNDNCECPNCHRTVTMKSEGRGKKNLTEIMKLVLIIARKNAVYLRCFYATKCYNGDPYNKFLNSMYCKADERLLPEVELSETARYYLTPGNAQMWKKDYRWGGSGGWYQPKTIHEPFSVNYYYGGIEANTYFFVNQEELEKSFLRYSDLRQWDNYMCQLRQTYDSRPVKYLAEFAAYPCIEYLAKAGFTPFVVEKVAYGRPNKRLINWNATKPNEVFKTINMQQVKELSQCEFKVATLKYYTKCKKAFSKIKISDVSKIINQYPNYYDDFYSICIKHSITPTRADNYLQKQKKNKTGGLVDWRDYLEQAEKLNFDMTSDIILMPKQLIAAHHQTTIMLNQLKSEIEEKTMQKRTAQLIRKYSFENDTLQIVVPKSMQEIISEGQALQHCVGGYAERHAEGKTTILFIRRKDNLDTPYYTLEIDDKTKHIKQYHGYGNESINGKHYEKPQEVVDFVKAFTEYVNTPKAKKKKTKAKEVAA